LLRREILSLKDETGRSLRAVRPGEESPDSTGQDDPVLNRETLCDIGGDGKCHRKYTVLASATRPG